MAMSFLFLFQGIAANMEVCEQIEKIACFISHYQEHKEFDSYSFIEYVYEDYVNKDGNSDSHHHDSEHDNMPSHAHQQCCQHVVFFSAFQMFSKHVAFDELQAQFDFYSFELGSGYLDTLFQPPQV